MLQKINNTPKILQICDLRFSWVTEWKLIDFQWTVQFKITFLTVRLTILHIWKREATQCEIENFQKQSSSEDRIFVR